jgi:hypothetical protein
METSKAIEPLFSKPASCLSRNNNSRGIAHNDVFDIASAVYKHADLPTNFT